jgi:hypothetical protein
LVAFTKSPEGRAVSYTLKNWTARTRYCKDGGLHIHNNVTNAARGIYDVMPTPGLCRVRGLLSLPAVVSMLPGAA